MRIDITGHDVKMPVNTPKRGFKKCAVCGGLVDWAYEEHSVQHCIIYLRDQIDALRPKP